MRLLSPLHCSLALLALSTVSGCVWFEEDKGGQINVYTAHHGTAVESAFPEYGDEGISRIFQNDLGWTIRLSEAYVTTKSVELLECAGPATPISLYWGPWAEDIIQVGDTMVEGIGGVTSLPASYCAVRVDYAPFQYAEITTGGGGNAPANPEMDGQMVLLNYVAEKDNNTVSGFFKSGATVSTVIDTSSLDGGQPITVTDDQRVPVEVTLSKTYDSFFEGIDFNTATEADLEAAVLAALENDTKVTLGTYLVP